MSYAYDLVGHMISQTYPTGRVVTQTFDSAGRLAHISGQSSGTSKTYANAFAYSAHGAVERLRLGNGRYEHTSFSSRLQPTEIGLGTSAPNSNLLRLQYNYGTTNNNGNVLAQTITAPGLSQLTQTYAYDPLNRLQIAAETGAGSNWQQQFQYDRYGNRNFVTGGTNTPYPLNSTNNPTVNLANNRLNGHGYDNAGNVTLDAESNTFAYDGENRLVEYNGGPGNGGASYGYDGDGRRVKKTAGAVETLFVYNASGQLVAEYTINGTIGNDGTSYLTSDALGTPRVISRADGSVKARHDHLPFGEEIGTQFGGRNGSAEYTAVDNIRQKFTSKEWDSETGLYYFLARYYSSAQGRFTCPDPLSAPASGHPKIPQSWNLYTYVLNNPLNLIDPDGLMWIYNFLDKDQTRIGIVWIPGNKIPKNLKAQGYRPLDFGGQSSRDVVLTDGSVFRLNASSGNPIQLRGPQESTGNRAYVNTGLINQIARVTAPMPKATGLFFLFSLNGGYAIAGSSIALLDAAAYSLTMLHLQSESDAAVMGTTSTQIEDSTNPGGIRNIRTDVSKEDFIKNMEASGYKATRSGTAIILDNGVNRYTVYDIAKSTGGPTAVRSVGGKQTLKIRLKP
jgi:RHS repeat-associated protein